jgi:hypothetical protein
MKKPSDFHLDLQEDRVILVAQLISQAYADTQFYKNLEKGDTSWSLGCRRYDWARHNIRTVRGMLGYEFLTILKDKGTKFTGKIGQVPFKFKKADANNPNKSIFKQYSDESEQLSLLEFGGIPDPCELSWRFLVEADIEGDVIRVVFVGANEKNGHTQCFWEVPQEKFVPKIVAINASVEESMKLEAAPVQLKSVKKDEKKA